MRVAVAFSAVNRRGGVERVAYETARFLAARGHQVTVFAGQCDLPAMENLEVRPVASDSWPGFRRPGSFFRACSAALAQASRQRPFDALASFGCICPTGGVYWAQSVHAAWLSRSRQLRGSLSAARWLQRCNPIHPVLLALEAKHLGRRQYRKVIALTQDVKRDLHVHYGVPPHDVELLPNGFAPAEFNVPRRQSRRMMMRERFGFAPGDRVIAFVANELARKGFVPLLRAMAALNDPGVKLLVAGRVNPQHAAGEIAQCRLTGRVKFVGSTDDVADCYAAADLFALPTQYEAWGMVIIEALACGLPVATSRLAGAAVAVREGISGQLFDDPNDVDEIAMKLRRLLAGQHAAADDIADSAQPYSWENLLVRHEQILLESAPHAHLAAERR